MPEGCREMWAHPKATLGNKKAPQEADEIMWKRAFMGYNVWKWGTMFLQGIQDVPEVCHLYFVMQDLRVHQEFPSS